jgi:hypothetical protein
MKTVLFTLLALLLLHAPATGALGTVPDKSTLAQDFLEGIRAYEAGAFKDAATAFENVAASGVRNPALFYNLGNAWFKVRTAMENPPEGSLGRAILWYERARRLAPHDPDLIFNLERALEQRKDAIAVERSPLLRVLLFPGALLGARSLQWWALGAGLVFWLGLGLRRFGRSPGQRRSGRHGILLGAFLLLLLLPATLHGLHRTGQREAVVLAPQLPVRSARGADAPVLFALHEGALVAVEEVREEHIKLRLDRNKVGWASAAGVAEL